MFAKGIVILTLTLALASCQKNSGERDSRTHEPTVEQKSPAPVGAQFDRSFLVDAKEQWGEVGCVPKGPQVNVRARYLVDPTPPVDGKRLRGEWLKTEQGTRWLVSYAGGRFHPELDGRLVEVRGQRCDKMGQAVMVPHMALIEVSVLGE